MLILSEGNNLKEEEFLLPMACSYSMEQEYGRGLLPTSWQIGSKEERGRRQ